MNATFLALSKPVRFPVGCSLQTSPDPHCMRPYLWGPGFRTIRRGIA